MDTGVPTGPPQRLGIVALSLFLAPFVRLWFLQGIDRQSSRWPPPPTASAPSTREGPGVGILDRNGKVIVDNRTSRWSPWTCEPLRKMDDDERNAHF